jgi:glutathione S-transferase
MTLPVLYSFRRCPYAIRARLALKASATRVELREVVLRNKPPSLLQASPKATVPLLILPDGQIVDQSLDIMLWALSLRDPLHWLYGRDGPGAAMLAWVAACDGPFKHWLDRYKYADRYPAEPASVYRQRAEVFIEKLEQALSAGAFLLADHAGSADIALAPFVRQFALVDKDWFDHCRYRNTRAWLHTLTQSPLWSSVMHKYPPWQEGTAGVEF